MNISEFRKSLSKINEFIYFDQNEYLREKSSNLAKLKQFIIDAENLLENTIDNEGRYFIWGTLGNLYRIYGEPKTAIKYLTSCVNYAIEQGDIKREIVSLIRLGEALKYEAKHYEAMELFNEAEIKCKEKNELIYMDFVLQHKGKCLLELGRLDDAEKCLLEALRLRELKNDLALIESTQQVLHMIESKEGKP